MGSPGQSPSLKVLKKQLDVASVPGLVDVVVVGQRLHSMVLEIFPSLEDSLIPQLELEDRLSKILKALICNKRDLKVILGPPQTTYSSSPAHREELWHDAIPAGFQHFTLMYKQKTQGRKPPNFP